MLNRSLLVFTWILEVTVVYVLVYTDMHHCDNLQHTCKYASNAFDCHNYVMQEHFRLSQ